jgi:hypothetical protein
VELLFEVHSPSLDALASGAFELAVSVILHRRRRTVDTQRPRRRPHP